MIKKLIKIKDKDHLEKIIRKRVSIIKDINNDILDLNDLDVSNITDMSCLFQFNQMKNISLDKWDVSSVENMSLMFASSKFNGDISSWDVSNVKNMSAIFAKSEFTGNIGKWNVSNVKDMSYMFMESKFNSDISEWDVSNVESMSFMFKNNNFFNIDISKWDVKSLIDIDYMFAGIKDKSNLKNLYICLNNWKPYSLEYNNIFNVISKNKAVYWSNEYINFNKDKIIFHIENYLAKQEKRLLIDQHSNISNNLIKREKFKI